MAILSELNLLFLQSAKELGNSVLFPYFYEIDDLDIMVSDGYIWLRGDLTKFHVDPATLAQFRSIWA